MCGGAEASEGEAPAGGYGGKKETPARVATLLQQSPERVTNRQNKAAFANKTKNPTKTMAKNMCRHRQRERVAGGGCAVFVWVQCEHEVR